MSRANAPRHRGGWLLAQRGQSHCESAPEGGESFFELFGAKFQIPLIGDFNIRNAAMAASAAHFLRRSGGADSGGAGHFQGHQAPPGSARHHARDHGHRRFRPPPDSHQTDARRICAKRYGSTRLWAIFEPRSNTTRRAVFQDALPQAFVDADGVFIARVARLDQLPRPTAEPGEGRGRHRRAGQAAFTSQPLTTSWRNLRRWRRRATLWLSSAMAASMASTKKLSIGSRPQATFAEAVSRALGPSGGVLPHRRGVRAVQRFARTVIRADRRACLS